MTRYSKYKVEYKKNTFEEFFLLYSAFMKKLRRRWEGREELTDYYYFAENLMTKISEKAFRNEEVREKAIHWMTKW